MRKHQEVHSVAIVGPGRVGQAMGRLLAEAGVEIAFVAARRAAAARRAVKFIGAGTPVGLGDLRLADVSTLLIATSDSAVAEVARYLARQKQGRDIWRGKIVLHVCGSLPGSVLRPLGLRGAAIGCLHPYQTVPSPKAGVRNLRGCFWGIEGDREAVEMARSWVNRLQGSAFSVRANAKGLYHLSAFMVCPTIVTLMAEAMDLLRQAGVPGRIARPMLLQFVTETARNFADLGARRALTGPAVRGDWATIRRHLAELRRTDPEFVPVYRALLKPMLKLAR